ncbi:hypothetical protein SFRURICE_015410, partial [Spodoptera frugiperda]
CLGQVVASATVESGKGSRNRSPGQANHCWLFCWFFENFSVIAWSMEIYPVYGNRLTPYYMELGHEHETQMVKSGCTLYSGITCLFNNIFLSVVLRFILL